MSKKHFARYKLWIALLGICPLVSNAQQNDQSAGGSRKLNSSNVLSTDTIDFGYRKMRVDDFNGSAFTLSARDLENVPATNLTNLLSGLVPGFFSVQNSGGTADESSDYWIRGRRTSAEGVLVLVDGQERDFGILTTREIESITVLKDASVSALYGTRGANGIILVNTKKGLQGRPKVEVSTQLINQEPLGLLKAVDALTYAENYNNALFYDGRASNTFYTNSYLQQYRNRQGVNPEQFPDVDWLGDNYKKSSWVQRHNINISGGSDNTRYFINGGFLSQNGMFNTESESSFSTNNSTNRYNLRSNLEVDVTPTTLLSLDLYGWNDRQNSPGGGYFEAYSALVNTPANAFPAYYTNSGSFVDQEGSTITGSDRIVAGSPLRANPWALLNRNGYTTLNRIYGSFRARLNQDLSVLTKGLNASVILSMDGTSASVNNRQKAFAYYQRNDFTTNNLVRTGNDDKMANGVGQINSQTRNSLDLQLSYNRSFGKNGVSATTFYNQYESDDQVSIPSRFQTIGYWASYNFDSRYSVDFTGSYHGVYKFAPGKRFGFFPTVSAGWTLSNEKFFDPISKVVDYLKFRGSYGEIGSQRGVTEFRYLTRLNTTSAVAYFGNTMTSANGYVEDIIANPNLTWETVKQFNVGADLRLLGNRLNYSVDYFRDHRTDMYLTNSNVSSLLGTVASVSQNIGEMKSKGFEMMLSWNSNVGDFSYRLGANYALSENTNIQTGEVAERYPWLQSVGYARGIRTGYQALGLFQSWEEIAASPQQTFSEVQPGDIKYRDVNGDGIIDRNDQVPLGYGSVPSEFFGIHGGLSFKGVGLNFLFQGAGRVSQMLSGRVISPFLSNGTMYEHQLDYWTPENPNASLPNISTITSGANNVQASSYWMRNSSYLRLKTVELYYQISENALKNIFLKDVRLFASGYNMFVWTKSKGVLDPEDLGNSASMPLTRNVSFGLTARF